MYSLVIAYLLWFCSGFGALGFHRFYLGKIPTGLLWMFTGGLGMFGAIYDFFTLPGQVREANIRDVLYDNTRRQQQVNGQREQWRYADDAKSKVISKNEKEHPERVILMLAKENKGILTISDVALRADITMEEAKKHLEALVSRGFAELRVRKSGSLVYVIPDMADKDVALEDF